MDELLLLQTIEILFSITDHRLHFYELMRKHFVGFVNIHQPIASLYSMERAGGRHWTIWVAGCLPC